MDLDRLEADVKKATDLIDEAEQRTAAFEAEEGVGEHDAVIELADGITDLLEEAQQLLLEAEVDDLPDPDEIPQVPDELDEATHEHTSEYTELTEEEAQPFDFALAKQDLEHRSRLIEARVYRKAADRIGPAPITEPGQANEQQDELLNQAGVALEAGLGSKPDPETLLALLELRVMQLEIKKARYLADLLIQIDPEGDYGTKGKEWNERFDTDKSLKDRGRCFIATAVYGANDAPDVLALRAFRDDVLARSQAGRVVTHVYYAVSPSLARYLESRPTLAGVVRRRLLAPLARFVRHD